MTPLTPTQLDTLRALLDRLIPADNFPGALAAGVGDYVRRQLAGDCAGEAPALALGFLHLDAEAAARHPGQSFPQLDRDAQDALLSDLEAGRTRISWPVDNPAAAFFGRMVELAHEGFYADPANGGNRDGVSWKMIGYDPRSPPPPPAHERL